MAGDVLDSAHHSSLRAGTVSHVRQWSVHVSSVCAQRELHCQPLPAARIVAGAKPQSDGKRLAATLAHSLRSHSSAPVACQTGELARLRVEARTLRADGQCCCHDEQLPKHHLNGGAASATPGCGAPRSKARLAPRVLRVLPSSLLDDRRPTVTAVRGHASAGYAEVHCGVG